MGDVISFPTAPHLLKHGANLMSESRGRSSSTANERISDVRRNAELREVHNAIENIPTFKTLEDVKQAARNLTEMLYEAREKGITKALIARTIWPRDSDNPSKRFDKLTVPREGDLNEV